MIIETDTPQTSLTGGTDYDTLAAFDAVQRDLSGLDFPTQAEVEGAAPAAAVKFTIDSESAANWLLGKLASIDAEAARIKAQAEARANELRTDREWLLSRFGSELEAFARQEAERRRRKTITLQQGNLVFRTAPRKLVIADGEAAFVHARTAFSHCIIEQTTVRLDTAAYIAEAERTGELLPGMDATPERETFKIDVAGPKGKGKAEPPE